MVREIVARNCDTLDIKNSVVQVSVSGPFDIDAMRDNIVEGEDDQAKILTISSTDTLEAGVPRSLSEDRSAHAMIFAYQPRFRPPTLLGIQRLLTRVRLTLLGLDSHDIARERSWRVIGLMTGGMRFPERFGNSAGVA